MALLPRATMASLVLVLSGCSADGSPASRHSGADIAGNGGDSVVVQAGGSASPSTGGAGGDGSGTAGASDGQGGGSNGSEAGGALVEGARAERVADQACSWLRPVRTGARLCRRMLRCSCPACGNSINPAAVTYGQHGAGGDQERFHAGHDHQSVQRRHPLLDRVHQPGHRDLARGSRALQEHQRRNHLDQARSVRRTHQRSSRPQGSLAHVCRARSSRQRHRLLGLQGRWKDLHTASRIPRRSQEGE